MSNTFLILGYVFLLWQAILLALTIYFVSFRKRGVQVSVIPGLLAIFCFIVSFITT